MVPGGLTSNRRDSTGVVNMCVYVVLRGTEVNIRTLDRKARDTRAGTLALRKASVYWKKDMAL